MASVLTFPTLNFHMLTSDNSCGIREVSHLGCPVIQQKGFKSSVLPSEEHCPPSHYQRVLCELTGMCLIRTADKSGGS